jgi:transcriptional regulator with XRE-family HTH domain
MTETLAMRLRRLRLYRRLSQGKLAANSGVSKTQIQNIERGDSEAPRGDTLTKLATALEIPVSELLGEVPSGETTRDWQAAFRRTSPLKSDVKEQVIALLETMEASQLAEIEAELLAQDEEDGRTSDDRGDTETR